MGGLTPGPSAAEPPRSSGTSRRRRITRRVRAGRVAVVVALAALRFPRAHAAKDRPRRRPSSSRSMRSGPRTLCHPPRAACGWPVRIELLLSKTGSHGARRSTSRAHSATAAGPAILQALVLNQRRVRLHLVAAAAARARRPAACAAVVGRVDLRHQCRHRRCRCCRSRQTRRLGGDVQSHVRAASDDRVTSPTRAAGVHGEPRGRLRPAVDLPSARGRERTGALPAGRGV